ncbi:MAG TPA: protein kinase [Gemmatimonadales bacterium]
MLRRTSLAGLLLIDIPGPLQTALSDRYRLERELGRGGMATVYVAQDLRHHRRVAVKVLRPDLAAVIGAERFLAEIQTTANLQHPHILPLHDSGEVDSFLFYVMPFVEGESLRERLSREKQLPIPDAVRIATEVASALDYAHRHHVIHRDIKPENILLHDNSALVADFGIALAVSSAGGGTRLTETGMSLGTPHYMSPEQAMGEREITARSDVYGLGAVLYEMLVGEPPFTGPTAQAVVAKVVTEEPRPLLPKRRTIPPHVEAAVLTALQKLPADRFASAAEFAEALGNPDFGGGSRATQAMALPALRRSTTRRNALALALVASLAGLVVGALLARSWLRGAQSAPQVARLMLALPSEQAMNLELPFAVSKDGSRIAYYGTDGEGWLRELNRLDATRIPEIDGGCCPFFSPDGRTVGAFTAYPGDLILAPLAGGPRSAIARDSVWSDGGAWSEGGWIYFMMGTGHKLARVRPNGESLQVLAEPDSARGEGTFAFPDPLPGERAALLTIWRRKGGSDIAAVDFATREIRTLERGVYARYLASGHLLVVRLDRTAIAVPFDPKRLVLIGPATDVLAGVTLGDGASGLLAVSASGTLLYNTSSSAEGQVVRVARDGRSMPVDPAWKGRIASLSLSPDGTRLAVTIVREGGGLEVWVKVLATGPLARLAFDGLVSYRPAWAPAGRAVTYISDVTGVNKLLERPADGSGSATVLAQMPRGIDEGFRSRDGRWIILRVGVGGGRDIYGLRPGIDSAPVALIATEFQEHSPSLSPDGHWLAYVSNESGRREVYVRPFPNVGAAKWQVSTSGGSEPLWANSGRELFFKNRSAELVAVSVQTRPAFRILSSQPLFSVRGYYTETLHTSYAVSADDRSFIFVRRLGTDEGRLMMVLNWFEELKSKVPR